MQHFICFRLEKPFLGKFGPKIQICRFKLKSGTLTNSNMNNPMEIFNFSVFDWKYSFLRKLFQKIKIFCSSWNLEPSFIRIFRIRWWFSFISFLDRKYPFWENLVTKFKIVSLSWNLLPRLFRICRTEWWYSVFPVLTENTSFGQIWSQNSKSFLQSKNWYLH